MLQRYPVQVDAQAYHDRNGNPVIYVSLKEFDEKTRDKMDYLSESPQYSSNIRGLLNAKTNQLKSELGLLQKMDKNTTGSAKNATRTRDSLQRLAQQFQDEPSKKE